jgi:hypothetical protein
MNEAICALWKRWYPKYAIRAPNNNVELILVLVPPELALGARVPTIGGTDARICATFDPQAAGPGFILTFGLQSDHYHALIGLGRSPLDPLALS